MKPAYMGGVRGYQSAVHRPGMGLSDKQSRRPVREPAVFKRSTAVSASPLDEICRRRRGFRVKTAFIASLATVAAMVALAFVGGAQF